MAAFRSTRHVVYLLLIVRLPNAVVTTVRVTGGSVTGDIPSPALLREMHVSAMQRTYQRTRFVSFVETQMIVLLYKFGR